MPVARVEGKDAGVPVAVAERRDDAHEADGELVVVQAGQPRAQVVDRGTELLLPNRRMDLRQLLLKQRQIGSAERGRCYRCGERDHRGPRRSARATPSAQSSSSSARRIA